MSATEIENVQQELEIASSGRYNTEEDINIRSAFLKLGYKVGDPRCNGISMTPDDITSCECVKAAGKTAALCTRTDGLKCFKSSNFSSKWTDADKKEKGINCTVDWPLPPEPVAPIAPVLVNNDMGKIAVGTGALLLLLVALGYVKLN